MFQYGEAVLVRPAVHYFGEEEDRYVLLPRRLGSEEVVAFVNSDISRSNRDGGENLNEPWSSTRPDSTALGMFSFQYCEACHVVGYISYFRGFGE